MTSLSYAEFLETTFKHFSGAFELIPDSLSDAVWLQVHVVVADDLLRGIQEATGVIPPEGITGYDVAMNYLEVKDSK